MSCGCCGHVTGEGCSVPCASDVRTARAPLLLMWSGSDLGGLTFRCAARRQVHHACHITPMTVLMTGRHDLPITILIGTLAVSVPACSVQCPPAVLCLGVQL